MGDMFSIPEVAKHLPQWGPVLKSVPASQRLNVYLHPWHLSLGEGAKAGRYPSMHQTKAHMPSVVWKNYQAAREALEIKCDQPAGDQLERPQQGRDGAVCAGISCLHRCLSYFIYIRVSHNFHLGWMNL